MKKSKSKSKVNKQSFSTNKTKGSYLRLLLSALIISLLILGGIFLSQVGISSNHVLGEKSNNSWKEQVEKQETVEEEEPVETPEPAEAPEAQEVEHEQEAKDVQHEVENQVQQGNVEKVEVHPTSNTPSEGTLKLEKTDGTKTEKTVPPSKTSLISIQDPEAGAVQISVGSNGTVTLVNNGITVTTNQPVVIDPKSQTIGIKTATGVTVISTLPSQAVNDLKQSDKPTVIQSAVLGEQNGQAYYDISGMQKRKFVGLIPVNATIETKINAQNGTVISSDKPWYLDFLGFLYTI